MTLYAYVLIMVKILGPFNILEMVDRSQQRPLKILPGHPGLVPVLELLVVLVVRLHLDVDDLVPPLPLRPWNHKNGT